MVECIAETLELSASVDVPLFNFCRNKATLYIPKL